MRCLTGARYTMTAAKLIQSRPDVVDGQDGSVVLPSGEGHYEIVQDPDSGAIERVWRPASTSNTLPGSDDIDANDNSGIYTFQCSARGFTDGGIRVAGTTERWSTRGYVDTVDRLTLKFPPNVYLSRRDRITLIRDKASRKVIWKEDDGYPTVYEVDGVTPVIDMYGTVIENSALLTRAEVQGDLSWLASGSF